jgi:hypothetical protein
MRSDDRLRSSTASGWALPQISRTIQEGSGSGRRCWKKPERFRAAYQGLGDTLLRKRVLACSECLLDPRQGGTEAAERLGRFLQEREAWPIIY